MNNIHVIVYLIIDFISNLEINIYIGNYLE